MLLLHALTGTFLSPEPGPGQDFAADSRSVTSRPSGGWTKSVIHQQLRKSYREKRRKAKHPTTPLSLPHAATVPAKKSRYGVGRKRLREKNIVQQYICVSNSKPYFQAEGHMVRLERQDPGMIPFSEENSCVFGRVFVTLHGRPISSSKRACSA